MKFRRLIYHSFQMMGRYKLRTFFMMLGSLIGIAALTFVLSVGQLAQRKILEMVSHVFSDSTIVIHGGGGAMMGGPRGASTRLTADDIQAVAKEVPGVADWDTQQSVTLTVRHGDTSDSAQILGESERWQRVWNRSAERGDYFDETAVKGSARVAVIGETVAQRLFGNDDPIGADIQIGSVPFKVIGILEPWGTDPHGMDEDNVVVVPVTTLMRRLSNLDKIGMAKLLINDPGQAEQMKVQIAAVLRQRHVLSSDQPDDFNILTATDVHRVIGEIQRVIFLYLPLVAGVSLIVGGIVSASLMLSSINDRIGEIGLRRAVGAHSADIRLQFLLETATTIVIGGVVGITFGYAVAEIAASRMHLGTANPWLASALGLLASTLVGLLAGVLPAIRAARLEPAEALR
jgi:putative ABC transport system permease protein